MAIIETINDPYHFWIWVRNSDSYSNNFTQDGAKALQAYLEEMSENDGSGEDTNIEFDPIAWCVEYTEYKSAWDAMEQYQPDDMPVEGEEGDDLTEIQAKNEAEALRWLQDNTTVIELDNGGVVVMDF